MNCILCRCTTCYRVPNTTNYMTGKVNWYDVAIEGEYEDNKEGIIDNIENYKDD